MSEIFFWGLDSIFMQIPPFFHYANMASGHMSEHTLLGCGKTQLFNQIAVFCRLEKDEKNVSYIIIIVYGKILHITDISKALFWQPGNF